MKVHIIQDPDTGKWIVTLTMPHVARQFVLYLGTEDMRHLHTALNDWWIEKIDNRLPRGPVN